MSHLQRITNSLVGIQKYISNVSYLGYLNEKKVNDVMIEYLKENNIEYVRWNKNYKGFFTAAKSNAHTIQKDFKPFKLWIRQNYPN